MVIAEINTVDFGSTGNIMLQISECARKRGHQVRTFSITYDDTKKPPYGHTYYSKYFFYSLHIRLGKLTGGNGLFSVFPTINLVKILQEMKPDIVHLHNLHQFCINLPILFQYLKKSGAHVIWTLHDCWAFTGHCPFFTLAECEKWKTGCYRCPSYKEYPISFVDNSRFMYKLKKHLFTCIEDMTIVTPSKWLSTLVEESFLKKYPVRVINNGVDLNVFKPTNSNFRQRYEVEANKFVVLGVASPWGKRKGLDVFIELAKRLDERFQIVLVGTDDNVDKQLPDSIISIHRTYNQQELAEIYTAADVFVNPTREDNYPTVNMESLACGTPVITFNTGGSPEMLDGTCGSVVPCNDIDALEREIIRMCSEGIYSREMCLSHAKSFDMWDKYEEYIELYRQNL